MKIATVGLLLLGDHCVPMFLNFARVSLSNNVSTVRLETRGFVRMF